MKIDEAILLAAGLGARLKPLTDTTPKPLLPLDGTLLIDYQLIYLASSGIKEVTINLHHLGEKIRRHVGDGSSHNLTIYYSGEPRILGTGGGIKKAATFLRADAFVVLNSDALQDTDISALARHHVKSGAVATMVVKKISSEDNYNPIDVSDAACIKGFGRGKYFYTGLQVLSLEAVSILPQAGTPSCLIKDGYSKLIEGGKKVSAFIHEGYFNDLGTPERYEKARRDIQTGLFKLCR